MKRLLTNNPLGPLPNMRLRYLDPKVVDSYLQALAFARSGDRGRVVPRIGSFIVGSNGIDSTRSNQCIPVRSAPWTVLPTGPLE